MKLYEAIQTIIQEFGKDIVTNAKVINVFSDYNAFEESKTFRVILKNLIAEGYMDQLMYVRDWDKSQDHIINNFVKATSFNKSNVSYVVQCLAFGLGYTKIFPVYNYSVTAPQVGESCAQNSNKPVQTIYKGMPVIVNGIKLDKTKKQFQNLSEDSQQKYKEAAEAYLESIVEFKSDFEKELGIKLHTTIVYDGDVNPRFEITGKIKVEYNSSIDFNILLYDASNRVVSKSYASAGHNRKSFEVVSMWLHSSDFHRVSNIKRIVVYWEEY